MALPAITLFIMFNYMPLRTLLSFAGEQADPDLLDRILTALNS